MLQRIVHYFTWRWSCKGGYRDFLTIAIPLILSTAAWSVQHFVDRMFLTWYSPETIAAAMPAGILNFTFMSLFIGTVGYVDTFIAQYYGAKRYTRIGPVMWQGIYIALLGGVVLCILSFFSEPIFNFVGHEPKIRENEITYFKILCMGSFPPIAATSFAAFYAGRGKTWTIMWVNFAGTFVNLVLDYFLIFGKWIFPEMGITGAAMATVIYGIFTLVLYIVLLSKKEYNKIYHTLSAWRFNWPLTKRIFRFGFPNGVQFFIDIFGFSVFLLIMGNLGMLELAATNIAFNINTISFMPMLGSGIAVSVMVGQYLGMNDPKHAERSTYSAFHLTFSYIVLISLMFVLVPKLFIYPFKVHANPQEFIAMQDIVIILLRFVAVYAVFDTFSIICAFAIKGAGDTKFVMHSIILLSMTTLVIPSYLAIVVFKKSIYIGWTIASGYVILLSILFFFRFLQGKWKHMRVIEPSISPVSAHVPENPCILE